MYFVTLVLESHDRTFCWGKNIVIGERAKMENYNIIVHICDRIWEKVHCRAHYDFSV